MGRKQIRVLGQLAESDLKTARAATGNIPPASIGAAVINWTVPFVDDNYTVVASVESSSTKVNVLKISTKTAAQVVVSVLNDDGVANQSGIVNVIAIHD